MVGLQPESGLVSILVERRRGFRSCQGGAVRAVAEDAQLRTVNEGAGNEWLILRFLVHERGFKFMVARAWISGPDELPVRDCPIAKQQPSRREPSQACRRAWIRG